MRRFLLLLVLAGLVFAQLPSAVAQKPARSVVAKTPRTSVDRISADQLKNFLYFIAADEMEGRDTPSRGLDTAANFIAYNLTRWGFKPGGDDGTFFQRIGLRRTRMDAAKTTGDLNGRALKFGEDFIATSGNGTISGQLVYVGNGYVFKDRGVDSYKGIDVKDKIMVILGALPKGMSFPDLRGKEGEDYESPMGRAYRAGAKGVIVVPTQANLSQLGGQFRNAIERGSIVVEKFQTQAPTSIPSITVSGNLLNSIFEGESVGGADILARRASREPGESFVLKSEKKIGFTLATNVEQLRTQNVVAIYEGSDPVLKNEFVAVGAHYDHVGVNANPAATGDRIFNGADDDGSGTVSLMAMAEALASGQRPKRSIVFIWHCGEEKGLWGSRYYVENSTVPLDRIIAQLNIDMIGRSKKDGDTNQANKDLSGPNSIYVIGSKMMSTELGELSDRVNKSYLNLNFDFRYDDPKDTNRFFFRSDHFNYAQKGIPIIFYFDGVHEDYHRVGDSPDKIDYVKMEKVVRTVFMTMWEIANLKVRPRVDKQLPAELRRN